MAGDRLEVEERAFELTANKAEIAVQIAALEEALARLPSARLLNQWSAAWVEARTTQEQLGEAEAALVVAQGLRDKADDVLVAARAAHDAAMDQNRAAHLRQSLEPGHVCPVCDQEVTSVPPPLLEPALERARSSMEKAAKDLAKRAAETGAAESLLPRLQERLEGLHKQTADSPPEIELPGLFDQIAATEEQLRLARAEEKLSTRKVDENEAARKRLIELERQAMRDLQNARDRLAGLDPPPLTFEDPGIDWKSLLAWALDRGTAMAQASTEAEARRDEAAERLRRRLEGATARFSALGVDVSDRPPRDVAFDSLSQAVTRLEEIRTTKAETEQLTIQRQALIAEQDVAALLVKLLRNDAFRNWLLDEVFTALVIGANVRLADLTKGQYSLDMSGREFEVIDNLSAGNRRSVKTLSGGETFLVSLGLALALADQVAETSSGSARLESIFLDEGFGTLDAETLDVVGSVIAELGASGKTVGIVTHVAELAEQMPVRYEVRKSADGATVTEVRQ